MLIRAADQPFRTDPASALRRRAASPPALRLEIVEAELPAGASVAYDAAPVAGMEQHVLLLSGALDFADAGASWSLRAGDCVRVKLRGPTRFRATGRSAARYVIAICLP